MALSIVHHHVVNSGYKNSFEVFKKNRNRPLVSTKTAITMSPPKGLKEEYEAACNQSDQRSRIMLLEQLHQHQQQQQQQAQNSPKLLSQNSNANIEGKDSVSGGRQNNSNGIFVANAAAASQMFGNTVGSAEQSGLGSTLDIEEHMGKVFFFFF
jgi:hypothetical protein